MCFREFWNETLWPKTNHVLRCNAQLGFYECVNAFATHWLCNNEQINSRLIQILIVTDAKALRSKSLSDREKLAKEPYNHHYSTIS